MFKQAITRCPLIASVQADPGSPLDDPETLFRSATASMEQGVEVIRLQGIPNIQHAVANSKAIVIGLIKKQYPESDVYISPTREEVAELIATGCQVIAVDATSRPRPQGAVLSELIEQIHKAGRLAMADCDSVHSAVEASRLGADIISTTLAGYTSEPSAIGPELELLREISKLNIINGRRKGPMVVAEGRYEARWQVEAALVAGADAVVVGGALNDPVKNTRRLKPRFTKEERPVIAIDIGATWLRAGVASDMDYIDVVYRVPLPKTRIERIDAIRQCIAKCQNNYDVDRVGISSAGVIWNNQVTLSKKFIPEHQGTDYNVLRDGLISDDSVGIIALGDGHASAWAHAMHPQFAGKDIVVLAIGTGLGFGHVREGKIVMGPQGEYSRLNDIPGPGGKSFEQILGGMFLTATPSDEQKALANEAVHHAIRMVSTFLFPDVVILCGTVGMQPWLNLEVEVEPGWPKGRVERSPLHADAGLYGAAALALYPPFV
jgi:putative N-acetylmannosamine-6-phosphate epimerase/predicted NBD/HSP70 family sugar kinase